MRAGSGSWCDVRTGRRPLLRRHGQENATTRLLFLISNLHEHTVALGLDLSGLWADAKVHDWCGAGEPQQQRRAASTEAGSMTQNVRESPFEGSENVMINLCKDAGAYPAAMSVALAPWHTLLKPGGMTVASAHTRTLDLREENCNALRVHGDLATTLRIVAVRHAAKWQGAAAAASRALPTLLLM